MCIRDSLYENRKEPGADREAAEENAGGMRMEQKSDGNRAGTDHIHGRCSICLLYTSPWEQVKRDGIDYIALYYVNEKGKQVQILDAELA